MRRITILVTIGLLLGACGSGIDSYEDGMEAQLDVTEEMLEVLEGVTDEASAKAAVPEIEALGKRLAEIAAQIQELPEPTMEELQELAEAQAERGKEFQEKAMAQLMKLGEYPELSEAFSRAMTNAK